MNHDQVLKIANECGFGPAAEVSHNLDMLWMFANLVAKNEREACAKVCEDFGEEWHCQSTTNEIANLIKARE